MLRLTLITEGFMPERQTIRKSRTLKRQQKAPTTQAGPFVEEEIRHVRTGKHGARSAKQAIAIGLSKARKAGVKLPAQGRKRAAGKTRNASSPSPTRSRATRQALKREGRSAASRSALSRQARTAARKK